MNVKFIVSGVVSRVKKNDQKGLSYVNVSVTGGEFNLISVCSENPVVGANVSAEIEAETGLIMAFNRPQCVLFPRRLLSYKLLTGGSNEGGIKK